jgi:hypothetical protein
LPYTIYEHTHRFAAWAASTAARSAKGNRFEVKEGKAILEAAGFNAALMEQPLPRPEHMDHVHREWRQAVIRAADHADYEFSHGVAAKIINVYLKAGFVHPDHRSDPALDALHPPIDRILLGALQKNDTVRRRQWRELKTIGWSRFGSDEYEKAIDLIRTERGGRPLWTVEEHWRGYQ